MRVIENVKRNFWDEIVGNCPYATFFHTPYWSELMAKTFYCIDITKGFIFDDGTRVVFPIMQRKGNFFKGFLNDYVSGYPYSYGGPIADGAIDNEHYNEMIEYINAILNNYYRILIRGNPYCDSSKPKGYNEIRDLSHVAELSSCENEDDLFKNYGRRYKTYIRKAIKSGALNVQEAKTEDEYKQLYAIYQKTKKHWNIDLTHYPLRLFRNLHNMKCKHIKLWSVYFDNIMIGGDVTLYWKNRCFMWLSYHDRDYSKMHHRRYLLHNVFLNCKEMGIDFYDFMQSGGIKSQEDFKRSMGGKEYPHYAMLKENYFVTMAKKVKALIKNSPLFF